MKKEKFFKDKVIIVTGASSGIGKDLALRLSKLDAKVVLAARTESKLAELEQQIKGNGRKAISVRTDMSVKQDVFNLVQRTLEHWGRIDILISNAGQYIQGYTADIDEAVFKESFEVNFYGSFYAVKEILPLMVHQNSGHFVFINTLAAKKGIVGDGAYVAAKAALDGFADVLRQEVRQTGIRVLTVYPGRVDTPMIRHVKAPWISPKISVEKVGDALISGILKGKPIVIVPKLFFLLGALNNLTPRFMDFLYRKFRIEGRKYQQ